MLNTPCREWHGYRDRKGYGKIGRSSAPRAVHRRVVHAVGEDQFGVPWHDDLCVLHLCDNPPCFRYDHLWLGTRSDNHADMLAKGRGYHPHKLSVEQVRIIRQGDRTLADLANEFGVSTWTVSKVRRGLSHRGRG